MRHLLLPPRDAEAPARVLRLKELGIGDRPVAEFDDFARELATRAGGRYAMVNFIDENRQYFAGLYSAVADTTVDLDSTAESAAVSTTGSAAESAADSAEPAAPEPGREMDRHQGYCPHVVVRRRALVLEDVRDFPRFAGNPVVDEIGIHSYLGAPLIDSSGIALGTICVIDTDPRPWGCEGLRLIKSMAARLVARIESGEVVVDGGEGDGKG